MRSPEKTIGAELWPMAMDHAAWLYNHTTRRDTGLSPHDLWSKTRSKPASEVLGRCHVWGCPTYVLEPKLQKQGVKILKWEP